MAMVKMAKDATPAGKPGSWDAVVDQEKEFEPSILNTSVWLMQMVLQVRWIPGCRIALVIALQYTEVPELKNVRPSKSPAFSTFSISAP